MSSIFFYDTVHVLSSFAIDSVLDDSLTLATLQITWTLNVLRAHLCAPLVHQTLYISAIDFPFPPISSINLPKCMMRKPMSSTYPLILFTQPMYAVHVHQCAPHINTYAPQSSSRRRVWKSTGREWGAWMHLRMLPVVNPTVPTMFRLDVSEMHANTMPAAGWRRSNSHPISKSGFLKDSTVIWQRNFCHMSSPYVHVFSTAPYNKRFFNSRCVIYWRAQSLRWHVLNSDRHTPECLSPDAEYNKTIKACSSACSLISNSHVTCPFINIWCLLSSQQWHLHVVSNTLNSLF